MILERMIKSERLEDLLDQHTTLSIDGCQHPKRTYLLDKTADWIHKAYKLYQDMGLEDQYPLPNTPPPITFTHISDMRFGAIKEYKVTQEMLIRDRILCLPCMRQRRGKVEGSIVQSFSEGILFNRPTKRKRVLKGGNTVSNNGNSEDDREPDDLSNEEDPHSELLLLARQVGGRVVEGRKPPAFRSRLVQPYQFKQEKSIGVVKEFNPGFDSYHTGPTAEALLEIYVEIYSSFSTHADIARWSTVTSRFIDQGYRCTQGGFHQFYLNEPSVEDQLAHFFPLPPREVLNDWKEKKASVVDLSESTDDLVVWTLEQMVGAEAGTENSERGLRSYLTGTTESGSYIQLDIHGSRKTVQGLHISSDIDSVLWVTDWLKVLGVINLHILPYKGNSPPINKHNHAYVDLYWPRTEEECSKGEISSAHKAVPISNLPNTHFADLGKGQGRASISVVFPRMKHRFPFKKGWETKIPYEIEEFWLEELVFPALQSIEGKGADPYVGWSLEDTLYKYRGYKEKTIPISANQLDQVQKEIVNILRKNEDNESFTRYGSFFFVLQMLGIKLATSCDDSWETLWDLLISQNRDLDWDYMESTENGELLVDIGFGFHPPADSQVVGFWDVDAIQLGFQYGGYASGVTHAVNTVSAIGGIHAEMTSDRRKRTHISHRLAYNLAYEIVRGGQTKKESFFSPKSAFTVDDHYLRDVKGVIDAYQRNKYRELGVRDEYRCRASSVKRLLPHLKAKVRDLS